MILDFNEGWTFRKEGNSPVEVRLPHDAMLTETRRAECRNGVNSGYFPGGKYIYEKKFSMTEAEAAQSVVLHFEGVYQNCAVLVNGAEAGRHRYGYTAFDVDISAFVQAGENTVTVTVDNSLEPNCRWYSGSGIYRPVTLLLRDKVHIKTVHIDTVCLAPAEVEVRVETAAPTEVTVEVWDGDTMVAAGKPGRLTIPDAKRWSAETPHLYRCAVKCATDEKTLDFGVRKLEWSARTGLLVNGERVLLRGGCIHHDHGVLGACEFRDAEVRRLRILKEQGFNAVRMAHNPASQITLDLCDQIGLYVMDETFDGWYTPKTYHDYSRWFEADWREDVAAMVESGRNHPSVIMWSIGNEVGETAEEKGIQTSKMLCDFVHGLDPTRPVTAGINVLINVYAQMGIAVYKDKGDYKPEPLPEGKGYKEKKTGSAFFNAFANKLGPLMFLMSGGKRAGRSCAAIAETLDVIGLNYAASRYDKDAAKYPDRLMVGSETMAADLPYNWARVKKYPQVLGDFVWSAWDYLGEACIGDWVYHSYQGLPLLAGQGMIDITGKPLAAMAFMRVVWGLRKEPFLAVRPLNHAHETPDTGAWQFTNAIDSWSWHGYEGTKTTVEVYANAPSVRLILNGKPVGTRRIKNFKCSFQLPYQPGTLTAEALDESGKVLSSHSLTTGGVETVLTAKPEKTVLKADGQSLCYLPIEFTDKNGTLKPYIEQPVTLEVSGAAALAGFGSALCKTDEVFSGITHNSYRGRCLAVLRSGTAPGKAIITVKSQGVEPVTIEIEVE